MSDIFVATPRGDYEITFRSEAWEKLIAEALKESDLPEKMKETGGILIGEWKRNGDKTEISIWRTSGPGPKSIRQVAAFSPDLWYFRDRAGYYASEKGWKYLGEWHRHPGYFHSLSGVDRGMAEELLRDEKWPFLLLPIINIGKEEIILTVNVAFLNSQREVEVIVADRVPVKKGQKLEGGQLPMVAYVDSDWISHFTSGDQGICEYKGIFNPGESWVFLPLPGLKNATLRCVREGFETSLPDSENTLTAFFDTDGGLTLYTVKEGEVREVDLIEVKPEEDVYERNRGLLETRDLADKKVLLAGCGSVGSTMAVELVRAGVGNFVLVDPDRLEPANICRHQAGLQQLGRKKVSVVKDLILSVNPLAEVTTYPVDICGDMDTISSMTELAAGCDLLICTTDTDESRIFINDMSIASSVPSIHAGLHERAESGIVQVVIPGKTACFLCHRDSILKASPRRKGAAAYSEEPAEEKTVVSPGLSAQINTVAEIAVLRTLEILGAVNKVSDGTNQRSDGPVEENDSFTDLTFITIKQKSEDPSEKFSFRLFLSNFQLESSEACPACGKHPFGEEGTSPRTETFSGDDSLMECSL